MRSTFGQEIFLTVHKKDSNSVVFKADGLRVDFNVMLIDGFSRGTFTLYNLAPETIRAIASRDNYVTLKTRLHGGSLTTIANSYYISNIMEEKKIPESVTTLYCFDNLKRQYLEKPVDIIVRQPTLRKEVEQILNYVEYPSRPVFKSFPEGRLGAQSGREGLRHVGTAQRCLTGLQKAHKFKLYTDPSDGIVCMYLPSADELQYTTLQNRNADVKLHINNMRSNPVIGVASLLVTSNLDGNIRPTSVLDISDLLTFTPGTDETTLQLAQGFLQNHVDGFTKYQTITVQHKGSNYTDAWHTIATCTAPTRGKHMHPRNWHSGK